MKKVICTDIYDKDGNLIRIEVHDLQDNFIIQALWDINDEQTSKNREEFRKWTYRHLKQSGYDPE